MRTSMTDKLVTAALATVAVVGLHTLGWGPPAIAAEQEAKGPPVQAKEGGASGTRPAANRTTRYPIRGKLKALDLSAQSFTLSGTEKERVIQVNSQTEIIKDGKPAVLADGVVGEMVGGLVERQENGTVLALKVRFGPKTEEEKNGKGTPKPKSKPTTATTAEVR